MLDRIFQGMVRRYDAQTEQNVHTLFEASTGFVGDWSARACDAKKLKAWMRWSESVTTGLRRGTTGESKFPAGPPARPRLVRVEPEPTDDEPRVA